MLTQLKHKTHETDIVYHFGPYYRQST